MTAAMEFSQLPDVFFTEQDTAKVEEAVILIYEKIANTTLYPGDPVRVFLTALAAVIAQRNIILDQTGKLNLLRYATGAYLDAIGEMLDCTRLDATKAVTTVRFSIAEPLDFQLLVPLGTRVTADSKIFFATTAVGVIEPGQAHIDIEAECLTAGPDANGLVAGQINKLVDPLSRTVSVANTTRTSGGADVEEDEAYRDRIHMAPEKFTCAGSELAYVYFAKSARPDISDVVPYSPTPGVVHIYVLLTNGVIPDPDGPEIADVAAALSPKKVRPLTDHVLVLPPDPVTLDYSVTYYLYTQQAGFVDVLDAGIKEAVANYESWQAGKIGRDINPDELKRGCRAAGAKRIVAEILYRDANDDIVGREPLEFTKLTENQVISIANYGNRVHFGGLEEE